eukprot:gene19849-23741_t
MNYYEILGISPAATPIEIHTAYSYVFAVPVEDIYSEVTPEARRAVINMIFNTLSGEAKGHYDAELAKSNPVPDGPLVSIPFKWASGALALLQEVGKAGQVLRVAESLLSDSDSSNFRQDLFVAMALSRCTLASNALGVGQVSLACTHLKCALKVLREAGGASLAPHLWDEVEGTLESLVPSCIVEQLSRPLEPSGSADVVRAGALRALKALLKRSQETSMHNAEVPPEYLRQVLPHLRAEEVLQLVPWTEALTTDVSAAGGNNGVRRWMSNLHTVATAHIAVGFTSGQPRLIRDGDALLQKAGKHRMHTLHLRAVCAVLLGKPDAALQLLEQEALIQPEARAAREPAIDDFDDDEAGDGGADMFVGAREGLSGISMATSVGRSGLGLYEPGEALRFCRRNAAPDGDLLPGLCLFTERLLEECILEQFRDLRGTKCSLVEYYGQRRVVGYLQSAELWDTALSWVQGRTTPSAASLAFGFKANTRRGHLLPAERRLEGRDHGRDGLSAENGDDLNVACGSGRCWAALRRSPFQTAIGTCGRFEGLQDKVRRISRLRHAVDHFEQRTGSSMKPGQPSVGAITTLFAGSMMIGAVLVVAATRAGQRPAVTKPALPAFPSTTASLRETPGAVQRATPQ